MYKGNNIIGFHRVAAPPTTTTTTTGGPTTTTTTTLGGSSQIYFGSLDPFNVEGIMAINNDVGQTFSITFYYSIDANCDNVWSNGASPNQATTDFYISTNSGNTWTNIDSVTASVPGGTFPVSQSDNQVKTGYTTITGITDITGIHVVISYNCNTVQDGQGGGGTITIYSASVNFGSTQIICNNYYTFACPAVGASLGCSLPTGTTTTTTTTTTAAPTTTTTTTGGPTTTTTTTAGPAPIFETYGNTGISPLAIVSDGTNVWTANGNDPVNKVTKVTPSWVFTNITGSSFYSYNTNIAFDGNDLWVSSWHQMVRLTTGGTATPYAWGTLRNYRGIVYDNSNCTFWVSMSDAVSDSMWYVKQFCAATGALMCTILNQASNIGAHGIAMNTTTGDLWTSNQYNSSVSRITQAGVVTLFPGTGTAPTAIAFDGTNMWTANAQSGANGSVSKITPSGTITTYNGVGSCPHGIAFDGTNMWTTNTCSNNVSKITSSGSITTYGSTGSKPWGITFDGTYLWTTNYADKTVTKITI